MAAASNGLAVKEFFFDRKAVQDAIGKDMAARFLRIGGNIRTIARRSMRPAGKKDRSSKPGEAPRVRKGQLKDLLFFAWDPSTKSLVVGPAKFPGAKGKNVPSVLERGGVLGYVKNRRRRKRTLGGSGEIRIGGRQAKNTKVIGGFSVTFARLRTSAQVDKANRLNAFLYGPEYWPAGAIQARPYMGPALAKSREQYRSIWLGLGTGGVTTGAN